MKFNDVAKILGLSEHDLERVSVKQMMSILAFIDRADAEIPKRIISEESDLPMIEQLRLLTKQIQYCVAFFEDKHEIYHLLDLINFEYTQCTYAGLPYMLRRNIDV